MSNVLDGRRSLCVWIILSLGFLTGTTVFSGISIGLCETSLRIPAFIIDARAKTYWSIKLILTGLSLLSLCLGCMANGLYRKLVWPGRFRLALSQCRLMTFKRLVRFRVFAPERLYGHVIFFSCFWILCSLYLALRTEWTGVVRLCGQHKT